MIARIIWACVFVLAMPMGASAGAYSLENVSFFDTPLACNAAPDIGCGSRSKPALLELEKHASIKEAWLNRPGTVIAVVWIDGVSEKDRMAIVEPKFVQHKIDFKRIKKKAIRSAYLTDFDSEGLWYRGADVDQLSIEEAASIADDAILRLAKSNLIDAEEAEVIHKDIEAYFAVELIKVRTLAELRADEQVFMDEMGVILERHIGKERAEQIMLWADENDANKQECKSGADACCPNKKKNKKADKSRCKSK